jgi:phage N-6-adenine-methyltransferase
MIVSTEKSRSCNWYTPQWILDLASDILGCIDLDPCSNPQKSVPAKQHFVWPEQDGLKLHWNADTVFCNPPYGRGHLKNWCEKMVRDWESIRFKKGLLLIPAKLSEIWWQDNLHQFPVLFLRGRVKFVNEFGVSDPATFGSALVYFPEFARKDQGFTEDIKRFRTKGEKWGRVYIPGKYSGL